MIRCDSTVIEGVVKMVDLLEDFAEAYEAAGTDKSRAHTAVRHYMALKEFSKWLEELPE